MSENNNLKTPFRSIQDMIEINNLAMAEDYQKIVDLTITQLYQTIRENPTVLEYSVLQINNLLKELEEFKKYQ